MTLTTLLHKIQGEDENPHAEICSPEVLRQTLREERARSNRSRNEFSFVLFTIKAVRSAEDIPAGFARALSGRVRAIDKVGWMSKDSVGVVLPATSFSGAKSLADEMISHHDPAGETISYIIYTYPFSMVEV